MTDIVFCAPNEEIMRTNASQLGFLDSNGNIITNGAFDSGGGWFLNMVGTIYDGETPRDGYWGRLRINGQPQSMPSFSSDIIQYFYDAESGNWTDGVNIAPDFVQNIGVIA